MSDFIQIMLQAVEEGGKIALSFLENSSPTLKPDHSVVTKADLAVSAMMRKRLAGVLAQPDHILIDEEDPQNRSYFDPQNFGKIPYLWAIDPIDGTRAFANQLPLFGISIGLLKDLKPWLGAVYFPALRELFYCDGQNAYFVKNAFTIDGVQKKIQPVDQEITRQSIFFGNDGFFKEFEWNFSFCQMMLPSCAVIDFCWPTIGRGCGCMFDSHVWDFGGSWPIAKAAGLDIRAIKTGEVIEQLRPDLFHGQGPLTWRMKENYLLSSERNFPLIVQKGIKNKAGSQP